ncbi:MAG: voltage-gated potassium channel [Gammaproteobacteria bacterium RBG_16_66_13]|nr:MAG: voltage-gated potassium channel [Gammaproteobacteria bacterium RBG_16_66_13]
MNYRSMGRTGLKLSEIAFGAWITFGDQIEDKTADHLLHRAYDLGVNFFDNADVYAGGQAEIVMGRAIRDLPRESLVVSSKVFWPSMAGVNGRGLSRKHVIESCHASLKRLGTDYLDLYFCHRYDPETPLEETVRVMDDLVQQGKVLYWGTSEWKAAQIEEAHALAGKAGRHPPWVEQPQYNMLVRRVVEAELAPATDTLGFGLVAWSPLRSGLLSGKYNAGKPSGARLARKEYDWLRGILTEENLEKSRALGAVAADLHVTQAQLCIGWLLRLPQLSSVITGATSLTQLEENVGAIDVQTRLTTDVLERIEAILKNLPQNEA